MRGLRRATALAAACLVLSLTGQNQAFAADPALPVPQTGKDAMLRLTSSVYPLDIPYLGPGESFSWQVGAVLDGPDSATATLELQGSGSLSAGPEAYSVTAQSCPVQWTGTSGKNAALSCGSGAKQIVAAENFGDSGGVAYPLGRFTTADQPWVLFRLERPVGAAGTDGTLAFGIGIVAGDDDGGTRPPSDLAITGMHFLPYLAGAVGFALIGALLIRAARRKEQP
ncbi:hypothetical protein [Arthrobacter rhizosphaerae]|uniref:hypothetical protein n=1 Tax=Arthrobacter rhizosphaerae TaxID=2855490 RepID=UPI001FF22DCC|nr:hypothetical protein [Arthrobacter rhizosphaerae]